MKPHDLAVDGRDATDELCTDGKNPIAPEVAANAQSVLRQLHALGAIPVVEPGFLATVRISCDVPTGRLEIEVFENHLEVWPPGSSPSDLWYEHDFRPDTVISGRLATLFA